VAVRSSLPQKKFVPFITGGSVLKQVEEKELRENWLTHVHLENKRPFKGDGNSSSSKPVHFYYTV